MHVVGIADSSHPTIGWGLRPPEDPTVYWLVEIVLFNAVVATLLALLAAGMGRALRRPALSHCLWILVLLKLVTPPFSRIPIQPPISWEHAAVSPRQSSAE